MSATNETEVRNEEVKKEASSVTMAMGKWLGLLNSDSFGKFVYAGFNSALLTRRIGKLRKKLISLSKEHDEDITDLKKIYFKLDDNDQFIEVSKELEEKDSKTGKVTKVKRNILVPNEDADLDKFRENILELENESIELKFSPQSYEVLDSENFRNPDMFFTDIDHEVLGDLLVDDLEEL